MNIAKVKSSAKEQIVTMPIKAAFPAKVTAVNVIVAGNERILRSCNNTWDDFFRSTVADDFCYEFSRQEQSHEAEF